MSSGGTVRPGWSFRGERQRRGRGHQQHVHVINPIADDDMEGDETAWLLERRSGYQHARRARCCRWRSSGWSVGGQSYHVGRNVGETIEHEAGCRIGFR